MKQFLFCIALCLLCSATVAADSVFDASALPSPITADVVLAIDTAFYGWGDRSESDVFVDALRPFLFHFVEILWNTTAKSRIRVAIVEMAKESSVLVELTEGTSSKSVLDTFNDKKNRRLNVEDRQSITHIYRMLNLVNNSVCNRSDLLTPCILVLVTVAPAPVRVRVSFVGFDWPNWRKESDAIIRSAFDLGVDVVVLTTGYHEYAGVNRAGLSEMARVEGRLSRQPQPGDEAAKPDWVLRYWQAGYNKEKTVDERVARRTVAVLRQVLRAPPTDTKQPTEEKAEEKPKAVVEEESVEHPDDEKGFEGLRTLITSTLMATILGFSLKQIWHLVRGNAGVDVIRNFLMVLIINTAYVLLVLFVSWLYGLYRDKYYSNS